MRSFGRVPVMFLASDEQKLIAYAEAQFERLCPAVKVITYPTERAAEGCTNHLSFVGTQQRSGFFAERGRDVLIEALLLARCPFFIHTRSNLATAVTFFNPTQIHFLMDGYARISGQ